MGRHLPPGRPLLDDRRLNMGAPRPGFPRRDGAAGLLYGPTRIEGVREFAARTGALVA
ncbi:hypothetical protein Shyhy01_74070 [Streptomyces hygroscopicus subsp. hygroscopicus]|nr:hypothetical protein Shyhy01_74070 [Streptomyces hygroscopicus subsp. hygroscopicus]